MCSFQLALLQERNDLSVDLPGTHVKFRSEALLEKDHSQEVENPDDIIQAIWPGAGKLLLKRAP